MKMVLIVEDEKMIRRGIKAMVQRSGVPVEVIVECANGEEALEILKTTDADVMFTDIRMPKMDGIELVNRVKELPHQPRIVAVSGYDDFSYAVEMLRNGVREYILKPVERTAITGIMEKFEQEFRESQERDETEQRFGKQQIRHILLTPEISEEEMQLLKQRCGGCFFPRGYVVCAFGRAGRITERDSVILVEDTAGNGLAIVEEENTEPFLKNELNGVPAGISRVHEGLEELRPAYEEAVQARKQAFCGCKIKRFGKEDESPVPDGLKQQARKLLTEEARLHRLQLVGTERTKELKDQWRRFFEEVKKRRIEPDAFFLEIEIFLHQAESMYASIMEKADYRAADMCRNVVGFPDIEAFEEYFMAWVTDLHERMRPMHENSRNQNKIRQAIDYIQDNYDKDLNMAVVSNHISMNYSLFSQLFKKQTGKNFVTYLKEIRIRKAKMLLADTDMKIIEISQKVGYDNEKNFMKVFKASCGVSPTEYRKNEQRKRQE